MKAIVLGGMGFIGSHLTESLVQGGHEVIVVSKSLSKLANIASVRKKVIVKQLDVTDSSALSGLILGDKPDLVFHLAGQLTSYESFERPLYDVEVNAKSTLVLLEAIRKLPGQCRLVLGSTFWVVGRPSFLPVDEETPCYPRNVYAASRLASEHYCRAYNIVYGVDTVVARFTNTFGPREQKDNPKKAAINYLIYKAFKGEPVTIYGKGKFFRDVIYVSDVVSALNLLAERARSGETYFVGSGKRTWFFDIGKWIHELTGAPIEYVAPPDYHKRVDVGNFVIRNTKMRSLGWGCRTSVREGIKKTLEHYRSEH